MRNGNDIMIGAISGGAAWLILTLIGFVQPSAIDIAIGLVIAPAAGGFVAGRLGGGLATLVVALAIPVLFFTAMKPLESFSVPELPLPAMLGEAMSTATAVLPASAFFDANEVAYAGINAILASIAGLAGAVVYRRRHPDASAADEGKKKHRHQQGIGEYAAAGMGGEGREEEELRHLTGAGGQEVVAEARAISDLGVKKRTAISTANAAALAAVQAGAEAQQTLTPMAVLAGGHSLVMETRAELKKHHKQLSSLKDRLIEGKISEGTYNELKADIQAAIKRLESEIASVRAKFSGLSSLTLASSPSQQLSEMRSICLKVRPSGYAAVLVEFANSSATIYGIISETEGKAFNVLMVSRSEMDKIASRPLDGSLVIESSEPLPQVATDYSVSAREILNLTFTPAREGAYYMIVEGENASDEIEVDVSYGLQVPASLLNA